MFSVYKSAPQELNSPRLPLIGLRAVFLIVDRKTIECSNNYESFSVNCKGRYKYQ